MNGKRLTLRLTLRLNNSSEETNRSVLIQAKCEKFESVDAAITFVLSSDAKSFEASEKAIISVGQTKVKSRG